MEKTMEFIPLRTLQEQIDAVGKWRSPAHKNFMKGVRRAWADGRLPKNKLV